MWNKVDGGKSGAELRQRDRVVRKSGPQAADEAAKLVWLGDQGLPVPEVFEVGADWYEMAKLPGRTADSEWSVDEGAAVIDAIADVLSALHRLEVRDCPFDRSLEVTVPEAENAARQGLIDLADLDAELDGLTADQLVDRRPGPHRDGQTPPPLRRRPRS